MLLLFFFFNICYIVKEINIYKIKVGNKANEKKGKFIKKNLSNA